MSSSNANANVNDNVNDNVNSSCRSRPPCGGCKFLRRKCTRECIFAPYFPGDNPTKFSNVCKVFGASNASKILKDLDPSHREVAANALAYEAEFRLIDPVHGCVRHMAELEHMQNLLYHQLYEAKARLANARLETYLVPTVHEQHQNISNYPVQTSGHMEFNNMPNPSDSHQQLQLQQQPQHYPQPILDQLSQQQVQVAVPIAIPAAVLPDHQEMRKVQNLQPQYEFQQ